MKQVKNNFRKYGFAIIGTGAIAHIHASAILSIESAQLLAVQSQTFAKAEEFAIRYGCQVFDNIDDLLQIDGLDIVCVCTPSGSHLTPSLKVIEAGKHCLIEKPIEITLEKIDQMLAAAKLKQVKIAVVFPDRFYPDSRKLKSAVEEGRFGKVVLASAAVKWSRSAAYYASAAWRGTWALDGGGALMNQAIHTVDMLQWCMGPVVSVMANTNNMKHTDIEVEDTVVAILKFANGALGTLECSTAVYPGELKRIEIMGTHGSAILEDNRFKKWQFEPVEDGDTDVVRSVDTSTSPSGVADPLSIQTLGHQYQMEDLISAINSGTAPVVDGGEGRKSVEIVLAIYQSAHTGMPVEIKI